MKIEVSTQQVLVTLDVRPLRGSLGKALRRSLDLHMPMHRRTTSTVAGTSKPMLVTHTIASPRAAVVLRATRRYPEMVNAVSWASPGYMIDATRLHHVG